MLQYYTSITEVNKICSIYNNFIDDVKRAVITRWRLSNHKLRIETDRYRTPLIPRKYRKCTGCHVVEDEAHAIFYCPIYDSIREKYIHLLEKYGSVKLVLDPELPDIYIVANLLSDIDDILKDRMMEGS